MMQKSPTLPHVEAKTNLMLMNALEATVDNNIERVYDFITAEDLDLNFLSKKLNLEDTPKMVGYDMEIGPWNHSGATKISTFEGDATIRETIIECQRPYYFQYMITEFNGGWFEGLIDLGISTFSLSSYGPRTHVNWLYKIRPVSLDKLPDIQKLMSEYWYPWQQFFFKELQSALNRDPWSA